MAQQRKGAYVPSMGSSLTSPGMGFVIGFIAIAVGLGALLAGGIGPRNTETVLNPEDQVEYELVIDPNEGNGGQEGLQLRTIKFKECSAQSAITMLLDRTGSMGTPSLKIESLKQAVLSFSNNLSDDSIIGIQTYSTGGIDTLIPVSPYKDVKAQIPPAINGIQTGGSTNTTEALQYARDRLKEAQAQYPDKKFSFIFFSDGRPNVGPPPAEAVPNPADEIKAMGVTIYSVGIFSSSDTQGQGVMLGVASRPDTFFNSPTGAELESIYKQIAQKICNSS